MSDLPPEFEVILEGEQDPQQREALLRAWMSIAQGDPKSFPVQFALAALVLAKSLRHSAGLSLEGHKAMEATLGQLKIFSVDEGKARESIKLALNGVAKTVNDETARMENILKSGDKALAQRQSELIKSFLETGDRLTKQLEAAEKNLASLDREVLARAAHAATTLDQIIKKVTEAGETAKTSFNRHGQAAMSVMVGSVIFGASLLSYALVALTIDTGAWQLILLLPPLIGVGLAYLGVRKAAQ